MATYDRTRPPAGGSSPPAASPAASPTTSGRCRAPRSPPSGRGRGSPPRRSPRSTAARAHASYEDLVADPDVDVVYIASPHSLHLEHARLAFAAGKHVLCEKPLTLNLAEAEEMVGAARDAGLFLMEAMWMACHPVDPGGASTASREGRYGEARQVHASIGFVVPPDAIRPDARPRARRGRAAGHGDLPADLRPPGARPGRRAGRDRRRQRRRRRRRRGDRRPARRRRSRR